MIQKNGTIIYTLTYGYRLITKKISTIYGGWIVINQNLGANFTTRCGNLTGEENVKLIVTYSTSIMRKFKLSEVNMRQAARMSEHQRMRGCCFRGYFVASIKTTSRLLNSWPMDDVTR